MDILISENAPVSVGCTWSDADVMTMYDELFSNSGVDNWVFTSVFKEVL